MSDAPLAALIERIVLAGVALTSRALTDASPGFDLTFPQWRVIVVLGERPDGATVSEVAERIGVTVPATSRQLRRLARRGLVAVSPDHADRRATRARLTDEGLLARTRILEYRRSRIVAAVGDLRPSRATLATVEQAAEALER